MPPNNYKTWDAVGSANPLDMLTIVTDSLVSRPGAGSISLMHPLHDAHPMLKTIALGKQHGFKMTGSLQTLKDVAIDTHLLLK